MTDDVFVPGLLLADTACIMLMQLPDLPKLQMSVGGPVQKAFLATTQPYPENKQHTHSMSLYSAVGHTIRAG